MVAPGVQGRLDIFDGPVDDVSHGRVEPIIQQHSFIVFVIPSIIIIMTCCWRGRCRVALVGRVVVFEDALEPALVQLLAEAEILGEEPQLIGPVAQQIAVVEDAAATDADPGDPAQGRALPPVDFAEHKLSPFGSGKGGGRSRGRLVVARLQVVAVGNEGVVGIADDEDGAAAVGEPLVSNRVVGPRDGLEVVRLLGDGAAAVEGHCLSQETYRL